MNRLLRTVAVANALLLAASAHAAVALHANGSIASSAAPAVTISKTCPSLRYLGRQAEFQIEVTNTGDAAAENVTVTDMIPDGLTFRAAGNDGRREGNNIVWRIGNLDAGQSRTLTATFDCNRIGTYSNRARVTYCVEAEDECQLEVKGIPAILLECVDDPDPIELNGQVTYTITITNQGSAVDTNIVLKCTMPNEEQYVTSEGPTTGNVSGQVVEFSPLPSLAPKARAVYKLRVKGVGTGDVRFRVEMKSDQIDSPVMETESTRFYE